MYEPKTEFEGRDLIAGNQMPVITGRAYIYSGDLKAGAVLGSRGVATSDSKAKKSITFTGTPVSGKVIKAVVNGTEVSYTTGSTTLATEVAGLFAAINTAMSDSVTASSSSGKLMVEDNVAGVDGNAMTISVDVGASGLTAGALTVETIGQAVGDELFEIVDSDSATSSLQEPVAVLLEDASAGATATVAFTGEFNSAKLSFATGDSLNTFIVKLRKIGIFARACV